MSRSRDIADLGDNNLGEIVVDGSGNVGIGTLTPTRLIHGKVNSATTDGFRFENTEGVLQLLVNDSGDIRVVRSAGHNIIFDRAGAEDVRIDSSGHLMVGTTDSAPGVNDTNSGVAIRGGSDNRSFFSVDDNYVVNLNRNSSDGDIAVFRKDGSTVGSIGCASSGLIYYFAGPQNAVKIVGPVTGVDAFGPASTTGGDRDNTMDLGWDGNRFKDLYLSGGVYLGGTGAANYLDDYEEGTFTATMVGSISGSVNATNEKYTKIGDIVHVELAFIGTIGNATFSGNISINGLPFTSGSVVHLLNGNFTRIYWADGQIPVINLGTSTTTCDLYVARPNTTGAAMTSATNFINAQSMFLRVTGSYRAA
jgi:hypothetical protein